LDTVALGWPDVLRRYPKPGVLEARLAKLHGIEPAQVLVTAGGDDAIDRLCKAVLEVGRELVLPLPGFEMIGRYAELAGGSVRTVAWPDGPWPREAVLAGAGPHTALVAMVSPNNPTGGVVTAEDLRAVSAALPGAVILLDHAYVEFAEVDLTALALSLPNVVVVRTFSKAWGLAGLRVGYAVGPEALIGWLRVCGAPYAVSGPSLAMVLARLDLPTGDLHSYLKVVGQERAALNALLTAQGAQVVEGQGNFAFAQVPDALWLRDACAGLGIGVRAWPNKPALQSAVRITCPGDPQAMTRVRHAVHTALAPEALLLDMDGVIADVRQSYRQAILHTTAHYGLPLTPEDVVRAKSGGNANNDWVLVQRMLAEAGIEVDLEAVTDTYETAYNGGLWQNDTLIHPRSYFEALAKKTRIAVVTGRPHRDADRFLAQFGFEGVFETIVCMEDATMKPNPAPVRLAMERLGITRAWMVGDTPDDISAARGAGVIPIGIVAPGEHRAMVGPPMIRAGAARVVHTLDEIVALLP
jgi:histidinol-phosphate aminotransferase